MRAWLVLAFVVAFPVASEAAAECYSSFDNPSITIIAYTDDMYTLVEKVDGKTTVMRTESGGTGIATRTATEPDGTTHQYRYIGNTLVMDMSAYELGCPGGHSWVNDDCTRVLITQVDAYAETALFYYSEDGLPITTCSLPAPFKQGTVVSVTCDSGRVLQMDARDFPTLRVDGVEMSVFDGRLPCGRP